MKGSKYETKRLIRKTIEKNNDFIASHKGSTNPVVISVVNCAEGENRGLEAVLWALESGNLSLLRISAGE